MAVTKYLYRNYPDIAGFSSYNLHRMRDLYCIYGGNFESLNVAWACQYDDVLIRVPRGVLDIHMREYASGKDVEMMQGQSKKQVIELLRYFYEQTDENHPVTVFDMISYLNGKGIQAVRQTVYVDINTFIDAGFDIVVVKNTQN